MKNYKKNINVDNLLIIIFKNLPLISFLTTFTICLVALYISSIFDIQDYSSKLGFSTNSFDYNSFSDGLFYKESLQYYSNWNFIKNIGNTFVAGPVVPFILYKLSFENLYILFLLFSLLISTSSFTWMKIIVNSFESNSLKILLASIIIFNPYNYYFVLKPGSEIPFQFFYALFCFTLLSCFKYYKLIAVDKLKKIFNLKVSLYFCFFVLLILILTRPTSLTIGFLASFLIILLLIFKPSSINYFKNDLVILNSVLIAIFIYGSFLYYEYGNLLLNWVNNKSDAIKYFGISNNITYFGIPETIIKLNIDSLPFLIRLPIYFFWKITSWILGTCGIRDSFSIISRVDDFSNDSRIWQVIMRVSYGLFIYLPILTGNLIILLTKLSQFFKSLKISSNNLSFLVLSFISISIISPNIFFFHNERYLFMVFPPLVVSFFYFFKNRYFLLEKN
tara:strand:+ start:14658 stop:16001 length:1344 start_codon:yes stop_codon:yes gene_type:complete